mmetsp:Transcript_41768/g.100248  ORF Transcript_41768/g.100248 Transcript_41768/m.100248 type:complete len:190 (+) Transcript_41768:43-612(+)
MAATAAAPTADELAQRGALGKSLEAKGDTSYYFAHKKGREDLSDLKQIEGTGDRVLATKDGLPRKASEDEEFDLEEDEKIQWCENYAWGDDGAKVKIYLELPRGIDSSTQVTSDFGEDSFRVIIKYADGQTFGLRNGEHVLAHKIVPEKCTHRVSSTKSKITVTLVKVDDKEPWVTLKKKVMSKATGWQ